jgi:hypothetical protein
MHLSMDILSRLNMIAISLTSQHPRLVNRNVAYPPVLVHYTKLQGTCKVLTESPLLPAAQNLAQDTGIMPSQGCKSSANSNRTS